MSPVSLRSIFFFFSQEFELAVMALFPSLIFLCFALIFEAIMGWFFFELFLPWFIMLMAILRLSIRSSKIDLTCFDKLKQVFRSNFQQQQILSFFKKLIIYECFWFVLFLHWLLRQSWPNISSIFACICFQIRNCYHILSFLFCVKSLFFAVFNKRFHIIMTFSSVQECKSRCRYE